VRWLPWAEYTYNTAFHTTLQATPFRVVYRDCPSLRSCDASEVKVVAVAQTLAERDEFLQDVRLWLEQAQQVAKLQYDRRHRNVNFAVSDWVYLCLHHRPHGSLAASSPEKLRQRYFGPYQIVEAIKHVAFRLALPPGVRLHDVFYVGLLKKFMGTPPATPSLLPQVHHGAIVPVPACVLRLWLFDGVRQALVQWRASRHLQPPGKIRNSSRRAIHNFSSWTSCCSRGE
jgi:hypothetical protein